MNLSVRPRLIRVPTFRISSKTHIKSYNTRDLAAIPLTFQRLREGFIMVSSYVVIDKG